MRHYLVVTVVLAGCSIFSNGDDPSANLGSRIYPTGLNRNLDVLFVVDNSGSMGEEQVALTDAFPQLVNVLATVEGGLPNLHVGVVSTSVGSGDQLVAGCSTPSRPDGDDGNLLTNDCAGMTAAFLSDVVNPDGSRERNYTGELSAVFSCMARLGTQGCGFEQPLESMWRALQPNKNVGFLRPAARLAVIFIGDEDDCSGQPGGALYGEPNATIDSVLGPRTSFRCHEHGVQCDDDADPRGFGTRTGCVPREDSTLVQPVAHYVDFLRSLKPSSTDVLVAGIIGTVDNERTAVVVADPDDSTRPALEPSCVSSAGNAWPGFRLRSFLEAFPDRHSVASICNDNQSDALVDIADELKVALGVPCFDLDVADRDSSQPGVQPQCTAIQYRAVGSVRADVVALRACDAGAPPCWHLESDLATCPSTPGNLVFVVDRTDPPAEGTFVEVSCVVNQ